MTKHNYNVDAIKFIAALLVIFSHSFVLSMNKGDYLNSWIKGSDFGALAVAIFFSFSGYFITASLFKKGDKKFISNRLKRLLPELFIVVFVTIFIIGPIFTNLSLMDYFKNKGTYLYFLNALMIPVHNLPGVFENNIYNQTVNGALWTLMVEFLCYIYIFIVYKLKLLNKEKMTYVFLFSLIISIIGYIILQKLNLSVLIAMIRPFLVFIFSSTLYFYRDKINKDVAILSILTIIVLLSMRSIYAFNISIVVFLPILLVFISNYKNVFSSRWKNLGNISYSVYLVGFITQQCVVDAFGGSMNNYLNFFISMIISIVLGYLLNELISILKARRFLCHLI